MSAHVERHCWDGSDEYASFGMGSNSFGRRMICHALLPVHVDHPNGGSDLLGKTIPEGSCEGDGQVRTDD